MSFDHEGRDDAEFERRLLASARADAPPDDAQHGWARFAAALGQVASGPAAGGGPRVTPAPVNATTVRVAALKWMLLGAIGGSLATLAVTTAVTTAVIRRQPRQAWTDTPSPVVARELTAPAKTMKTMTKATSPAMPPGPHARLAGPANPDRSRRHEDRSAPVSQVPAVFVTDSSTLAAEVSRIDAARTSNAAGDYDGTLRLIERYHRDFPNGALAPDADVVALEAVAATRDHAETARRAALFLSRYPGDPHAARVKWLADQ